jgi:hypothetical protein
MRLASGAPRGVIEAVVDGFDLAGDRRVQNSKDATPARKLIGEGGKRS